MTHRTELVAHLVDQHGERPDVADWWYGTDRGGRPLGHYHDWLHRNTDAGHEPARGDVR